MSSTKKKIGFAFVQEIYCQFKEIEWELCPWVCTGKIREFVWAWIEYVCLAGQRNHEEMIGGPKETSKITDLLFNRKTLIMETSPSGAMFRSPQSYSNGVSFFLKSDRATRKCVTVFVGK